MKSLRTASTIAALVALAGFAAGCTGREETPDKPAPTAPATSGTKPGAEQQPGHEPGHEHGAGPHGGAIADWGGGAYHVEFTVDHDRREATVYILGDDAETPAPIRAAGDELGLIIREPAFELTLKASPQAGDPEGTASRFTGVHENLGTVQEFAGTITAEVEGTPYSGDFEEEAH